LDNARINARVPPNRIQWFAAPMSIDYAGYCFDDKKLGDKKLVLAPHAHAHVEGARPPQFLFDLATSEIVAKFWAKEIERLTSPPTYEASCWFGAGEPRASGRRTRRRGSGGCSSATQCATRKAGSAAVTSGCGQNRSSTAP
jgi:hypothetical protein